MCRVRRVIALLLMMTLPAYAWAVLGVSVACPMLAMPMAEMADVGGACCGPADVPAGDAHGQPGKADPCKPGQECKTGNLYDPQFPPRGEPIAASDVVVAVTISPIVTRDPAGVWRPPRSL